MPPKAAKAEKKELGDESAHFQLLFSAVKHNHGGINWHLVASDMGASVNATREKVRRLFAKYDEPMPAFVSGHQGTEDKGKGKKKTVDKKRKRDVQDIGSEDGKDEDGLGDAAGKERVDDEAV